MLVDDDEFSEAETRFDIFDEFERFDKEELCDEVELFDELELFIEDMLIFVVFFGASELEDVLLCISCLRWMLAVFDISKSVILYLIALLGLRLPRIGSQQAYMQCSKIVSPGLCKVRRLRYFR